MTIDIENKIFEVLKKDIDSLKNKELNQETILDELGMDSIDFVEVLFNLEDAFDIAIPSPGEIENFDTNFKTVGDIVEAVQQLIAEKTNIA